MTSVTETVTTYTSTAGISETDPTHFSIFPNPAADVLIIQAQGMNKTAVNMQLINAAGKIVQESNIPQGGTMGYFQVGTLYGGTYQVVLSANGKEKSYAVIIE